MSILDNTLQILKDSEDDIFKIILSALKIYEPLNTNSIFFLFALRKQKITTRRLHNAIKQLESRGKIRIKKQSSGVSYFYYNGGNVE